MRHFSIRTAKHIATLFVVAVLGGFVVMGGPTGSSEPAAADFCPGFLKADNAPDPARNRAGLDVVAPELDGLAANKAYGKKPATLYEHLGSSGLTWTRYDESCGSAFVGGIQNMVANQLFQFSSGLTSITVSMYSWAMSPDLMEPFLKPMNCLVKGCNGAKGLDDALFLNFLQPVLIVGALWMGYTGLVKKSSTQAWQGAAWMIGSTALAIWVMANPTSIAKWGNQAVGEVTGVISNAATSAATTTVSGNDECYLPDGAKNKGHRTATCSMWKALAYTPWTVGQYGVSDAKTLKDKENTCVLGKKTYTDRRIVQLCAQTQSHDEEIKGTFNASEKADTWKAIAEDMKDDPAWSGKNAGFRVNIGFSSIIGAMAGGTIVVLMSFKTVVFAFGFIMLLMIGPIFLLVGVHPGFGRGALLKWAELTINTVVKRIVAAMLLTLLVVFFQMITAASMSWVAKIAMMTAVGIAGLMYQKPLMEAFNVVRLGGSQTGLEQGNGGMGRKASGAAASAVGGGAGALAAGGGVKAMLGSAVTGAAMARTGFGGAPATAARSGASMGRQKVKREAAAQRAAEDTVKVQCQGCGKSTPRSSLNKDGRCPSCQTKEEKAAFKAEAVQCPNCSTTTTRGSIKDGRCPACGGGTGRGSGSRPTPRPGNAKGASATTNTANGVAPRAGQAPTPATPPAAAAVAAPAVVTPQAPESAPRPQTPSLPIRPTGTPVPTGDPAGPGTGLTPPAANPYASQANGTDLAREVSQRIRQDGFPQTPTPAPSRRQPRNSLPPRRPRKD